MNTGENTTEHNNSNIVENEYWSNIRIQRDWIMIENNETIYQVHTFDDGNNEKSKFTNQWFIYGYWEGKVALVNKLDPDVRIESISRWKIKEI
tara:strand:+ start:189 stop:467 length:279 start_codon:yes stop_codon:yes gene_type:complete